MQGPPNPYSPPQHPQQGYPQQAAVDLPRMLRIAKNQRAIMLCILAQIAVASVGFFIPIPALVLGGLSLVVGIASIVFTVTLARVLYSMAGVIICVAILLIPFAAIVLAAEASGVMPLVSLLTLFVVNQRATKELTGAGFKVGLLGGDPADIEPTCELRLVDGALASTGESERVEARGGAGGGHGGANAGYCAG